MAKRISNASVIIEEQYAVHKRISNATILIEEQYAQRMRITNAVIMVEYNIATPTLSMANAAQAQSAENIGAPRVRVTYAYLELASGMETQDMNQPQSEENVTFP